jgi:hypothetical protein
MGKGAVDRLRRRSIVPAMARLVASELGVDLEQAKAVAAFVESELAVFEAQVCSGCPFFCLANADEDAEGLLEGDEHPANVEEE